jgi:hypothetical protein
MRPTSREKLAYVPKNVRKSSEGFLKRSHSFKRVSFFLAVVMVSSAALVTLAAFAHGGVAPLGVAPLGACVAPPTVYVDDTWIGTTPGTDPDGAGPATDFGCDSFATIQDGINGVTAGGTVNVNAGIYTENVTINKTVALRGAQFGVDARGRVASESTVVPATASSATFLLNTTTTATVIDGFDFGGGTSLGVIQTQSGTDFSNLQIRNNRFSGYSQSAVFMNRGGSDITIDKNVMEGSSIAGSGQAIFCNGPQSFAGLFITNNNIVNNTGRYGLFVDGNHNVGESATRAPSISGNLFNNNLQGMNLGSRSFGTLAAPVLGTYGGTISNNTFSNNAFDGVQGGFQHVLVSGNTFVNNGRSGIALTSFGNLGADRGAQNSVIISNTFSGNGGGTAEAIFLSATQVAGSIATNQIALNRIVGNNKGTTYNGTETVNLENNWWGCNAGPGNPGCDTLTGTGAGTTDANPWIVLGVTAVPSAIPQGGTSTVTADMTDNSAAADTSSMGTVPLIPVSFSATEGTMSPPSGTITAGQASSTFTSTSANNGTGCAFVDSANICANITVLPLVATITPAGSPTATDNDYTRINNAIQSSFSGQTIRLVGSFNWTEANAAASWAKGSNDVAGDGDDYSILAPANLNNVTFTADNLGDAEIQGPGDLAGVNLEGVFFFDGTGDNQNWTISKIRFLDFDLAIGMFASGVDDFNNTHITNNYIRIPTDLNATVAPVDVNQNIGIHFSFGTNQVISGNSIDIQGNGVSDSAGGNFSSEVGMQSNTSGGAVYDGLQITNNVLHVLNQQSSDPETVLGIWENSHGHTGNVTVSGNTFTNQAAGNNPAVNLQRGFRVTSHSSATTTVTYQNNTVTGANIGFQWLAGSNFSGNQAVVVKSNTITGNRTGVLVQSQGLANLSFNRITGNTVTGLNNVDGTATAENNWWGCNAGPGSAGCDVVTGVASDFNPWLVLGISASPSTIPENGTSTVTADMTHNSDAVDTSASGFVPQTAVTFGATNGTMTPPSGTITSGQATSTFTSTAPSNGTASATVDNQTVNTNITVQSGNHDHTSRITDGDGQRLHAHKQCGFVFVLRTDY